MRHDDEMRANMIRLGLCCIFRDQPIKFVTTTATAIGKMKPPDARPSCLAFAWRMPMPCCSPFGSAPKTDRLLSAEQPDSTAQNSSLAATRSKSCPMATISFIASKSAENS